MENTFYQRKTIQDKFNILAENFIIYKTLLGDQSDKIAGIKGLGEKGLFKKFPELQERPLTLDDIYNISVEKLKEHVVYARIVQEFDRLEKNFQLMNLSNPILEDTDKEYLEESSKESAPALKSEAFLRLYNEDGIGKMIRNVDFWLKDVFKVLNSFSK